MSSWAEVRRADRAAAREQDRLDTAAAASLARAERAEQARAAEKARERHRVQRAAAAGWTGRHMVELLIYPLALVCAVMAVPAMGVYGVHIYGNITGVVLPVLSELGMWAFALAVHTARRKDPDRPTVMLTAGIVVFAAVGAGLNFAHGLDKGVLTGVVMAVVSVAGVVAHQLAVAAPPRSRAEREQAKVARLAARRIARTRRIAARRAVVALAADGTARLVYAPGLYLPKGRDLAPATVPGLPAAADDEWDTALAALLDDVDPHVGGGPDRQVDPIPGTELGGSGGVALADPPPPVDPARSGTSTPPKQARTRTAKQVRAAAVRLARKHGKPVSAEFLRRELKIAPDKARSLRDDVNTELYPNP